MFDIHHHLLFGLDDGAPDIETSVAMARIAAEDGITHIVCTPHASGNYAFQAAEIAVRLGALREALQRANVPLTLGSGCDFHLSYDNIRDAVTDPAKYAINGGSYLLIELPDFGFSPNLSQAFYDLQLAGLTLILTHPERNPTLQREPSRMADWLRSGVLIQITGGSLLGHMGKTAERTALKLLDERWVHFVASDAHNTTTRPPRMSAARELIAQRCGRPYADLLCTTNPSAAFNSTPLGEQPAPRGLYADAYGDDEDEDDVSNRPWWKRVLGR